MWQINLKQINLIKFLFLYNKNLKINNKVFINIIKINNYYKLFFQSNKFLYYSKFNLFLFLIKNNIWVAELILQFGANNTFFLLRTPIIKDATPYLQFWSSTFIQKNYFKENNSEILFSISVGRCGFKKSEKRTTLALDILIRAIIWICKRFYQFLTVIKLNFNSPSVNILQYIKNYRYFFSGEKKLIIHSINDISPLPYNGVRKRRVGRSRFRYHRYMFTRFYNIINSTIKQYKK